MNLALLAKQGWRVATREASLLFKVLKGRDKVVEAVGLEEAETVLAIPLSRMPTQDKLVWNYTKCDNYLTCSGYRCAIEMKRNGDFGQRAIGNNNLSQEHES
ncbi:hypothetical protein LIER_22078 [Lithospermum erythrorhizon]|uniref:Uncharacterized protein n=1 Tax=Lithospermum erythrorhizon TaxID=34254 RepID=A0AAV3QVZ6_LITER